ncbi:MULTISPECIES: purine nucleoside transporter PunC [unclassified Photobacterium]|uniref:purine nucleoside transporter PunC n=1 Tax=unclassified Photobacterium TaxID=2628852 RepID=UPI000D1713AA|nr:MULTISPECIES: purine nucleoside transporter PunC [unclassified Photobacterium]PSV28394.1 Bcr/CflA family multidrug efflux MFS transporter [Photobacterium sp. GB-56]PSV43469.1 Bcr/CflA family multidrug efflux MFS transporter [Photobacterium sp. GB-36]PSV51815.1 Bcr/CflA family multidrug efflux MFS transporter [Photobacterium sp. GB-1]PSV56404.1 Bcr/CflA family multidrug efflux MFS transporter [Photobacterium sp. GB-3]PSW72282.1 Bcr/CflA family multidrug efflux MFS transporter [Photobacterium
MNKQHAKPSKITLFWFACLSMLGFLATDMYLPAFETIRADFATTQSLIGLSLSIFLLGMALGQLVYGPLSDRIGRIKVLLGGIALFSLGSLASAFASNIEVFLLARFAQALGACSATVIWQAVVVDRYEGKTSERVFATIMPLVALSPALAPLLGALLEHHVGWRSIFIALVGFGAVLAMLTLKEKESAALDKEQESVTVQLRKDYSQILRSKKFWGNMVIFAACSAAFFAYLTGSPFVMSAMGYSGADIGLSYAPQTVAFIVGGYGCRTLLNRYSGKQLLPWILALFFASVAVMFVISTTTTVTTIWPILIPFCFLAVANGAIYPIVISSALSDFKNCSATAAGLLNFMQTMVCFAASGLVSAFAAHGLLTVTTGMFITGFIAIVGFVLVVQARKDEQDVELQTA